MNASSALLTKVEHLLREAFNPIAGDGDRFRIGSDPNADALRRRLRLANLITQNLDRLGLPLHIDPDAGFFTDPQDLVLLDDVSMSLKGRRAFFTKQNSNFGARPNLILTDDIVRIVVADGNTVSLAAFDVILLRQRPPHAPAEEEALIVANHAVPPDHRTL